MTSLQEARQFYTILPMSVYEKVYEIVKQIPPGRVLTYGVISHMLNSRLSAQGVGWALNGLKSTNAQYNSENVPWHRVVNSRGGISTNKQLSIPPGKQKFLLEEEGVIFDFNDTIILKDYMWLED